MPGDPVETPIWESYGEIVKKADSRGESAIDHIERSSGNPVPCETLRKNRFQFETKQGESYRIVNTYTE